MHAPRLESPREYKRLWDRAIAMVDTAKKMGLSLTMDQITPDDGDFLLIDGKKPMVWLQNACAEAIKED